jgi:Tfp pilus assembly protein PilF
MISHLFGRGCLLIVCVLVGLSAPHLYAQRPPQASPEVSYNLSIQAMNRGDYREALDQMQTAITGDPGNLDYQYALGIIYSRLQRWEEAEGIFLALVQQDERTFRKAYFDLAYVYLQRGNAEKALEMVEKALPVDPGRAH